MALQPRWWVMAGSLALALAQSASAQAFVPYTLTDIPVSTRLLMSFHSQPAVLWNASDIPISTRLLTAFDYEAAAIPGSFVTPYGAFASYPAPPAIYAPGEMGPVRPALEPVQVTTVTLRADTVPTTVNVKPDTVITWVNATDRDHTLVIETTPPPGGSDWTNPQIGTARANGSISLMFHQPGSFDYYLQDQPTNRAHIVVAP